MSENTEATTTEVVVNEVPESRKWKPYGEKAVSGVVIFLRNRIVASTGKEDGWFEYCLAGQDGKPDESWTTLYSDSAKAQARVVGTQRKAAKAAEAAAKAAAKAAEAGPSEVDKLRAELSALTAVVNELAAKVAALTA